MMTSNVAKRSLRKLWDLELSGFRMFDTIIKSKRNIRRVAIV